MHEFFVVMFRNTLIFFLIICNTALAQQQIKFEHLMPEDGLSNSYINCIYQDREGFMWFGTFDGLDRFDGYHFYDISCNEDSTILSHCSIYALCEDKNGDLWIGTENGLDVLNRHTNTIHSYTYQPRMVNQLSSTNIRALYEDDEGIIWIGTYGGGLNRFDPISKKFSHFVNIPGDSNSIASNIVNTIFVDREGTFWIGNEYGGLSSFNKTTGSFSNFHNKYSRLNDNKDDVVMKIIEDGFGNIWFGTWNEGLFQYNKTTHQFKNYRYKPDISNSLSGNTVLSLLNDKNGQIWIGTYSRGLNRFDPQKETFTRLINDPEDKSSLSHNTVWSLFQDKSGIIWVGTFGGGINKFDPQKDQFKLFQVIKGSANSLSNNMITSLCEDHLGILWIGTFGGGLNEYNRSANKYNCYFNNPNSSESIIRRIFEDSKYRLWVSTENGLYVFNKNRSKITVIPKTASGYGHNNIYSICEDKSGNIWFGTWTGGLKKIDAGETKRDDLQNVSFQTFKLENKNPDNLSDNTIWDIIQDKSGNLWVGTATGIYLFDEKNFKFTDYLSKSPNRIRKKFSISCLYESRQGEIWFGTFGYGFGSIDYKNGTYQLFNKNTGFEIVGVVGILEDNRNNLWISTDNGIIRFDEIRKKIRKYDVSDGLQGSLFHKGAYAKLRSGEIVFGGINGFNIFHPDSISTNLYNPPIYITDIKLFNKSVTLENAPLGKSLFKSPTYTLKDMVLSYKQNVVTIYFAALDFSSPERNNYLYKLEGFDKDWNYATGKNNFATYTNLKGGDYIFRVKSENKDGSLNNNEAILNVRIVPPYWMSIWFKLLISLIFIILILFAYRSRLNNMQKQFERDNLNKEREIIKLRNEKLNSELDYKTKELALSALHLIRKNEDIVEIKNILGEIAVNTTPEDKAKIFKVLKLIDTKLEDGSNWEYFEYNFNLIHDNFLKRMADKHPDINQNDLKICAYIRMNLSTKEIANLLNISYRTIESTRYRMRKKMCLDNDKTLNEYIMRF